MATGFCDRTLFVLDEVAKDGLRTAIFKNNIDFPITPGIDANTAGRRFCSDLRIEASNPIADCRPNAEGCNAGRNKMPYLNVHSQALYSVCMKIATNPKAALPRGQKRKERFNCMNNRLLIPISHNAPRQLGNVILGCAFLVLLNSQVEGAALSPWQPLSNFKEHVSADSLRHGGNDFSFCKKHNANRLNEIIPLAALVSVNSEAIAQEKPGKKSDQADCVEICKRHGALLFIATYGIFGFCLAVALRCIINWIRDYTPLLDPLDTYFHNRDMDNYNRYKR